MNDSPDSLTADPDDDASLLEHRREAAKVTRWFIVAAVPFVLMLFVLIGAFAWNMQRDGRGAVAPMASTSPARPASGLAASGLAASDPAAADPRDAEIARLRNEIAALQASSPPVTAAPGTPAFADPGALAQMSARLDRVEANQRTLAQAAAAANAAVALQQAAHGNRPFLAELAVVETTVDDPALIALLRPHAETGVPSEAALAIDFPAAARQAHAAAGTARADNSLLGGIGRFFGSFISIRRTGDAAGTGPDALLHRAETRLAAGDLRGAVTHLGQLPPAAQAALKPWLDRAQARLSVDDATHRLTQTALTRLSQGAEAAPPVAGGVL